MGTPHDKDSAEPGDRNDHDTPAPGGSDSILDRIEDMTGTRPTVALRDDGSSAPPSVAGRFGAEGDRVAGKYVIEGELGRGGVGVVWRGRDQELGRVVAMKFLHDRYQSEPAILHRFVEEAQIGGQLQHPGIVPVYDLGMRDGRPFFAMKLIKGETLAKRLAAQEPSAETRREMLDVFESVCHTMAYAHARGVVHRDLKPANIMIGSFGEVQVVDWGMAKVLTKSGAQATQAPTPGDSQLSVLETLRSLGEGPQSIAGSVMGTPAYMAPEQARGDVDAMDERSDVFALGAILCEILTGLPPYFGSAEEMLQMAAAAKVGPAYARLDQCGAEADLVELCKLCLAPAAAARPRSAEMVAKVVHAHLAAVESRLQNARVDAAEARVKADSLRKMQRLGIAFTTCIAAALLVSVWLWQAARSAAESERKAKVAAEAAEQVASLNERRAVEIKTLIREMLLSITPERALGADTTLMRDLLKNAADRVEAGEVADGVVAAELRALIGQVLDTLGAFEEAEHHLRIAHDAQQGLLGAEHPETLKTGKSLADTLMSLSRTNEAETLYGKLLPAQRRVLGPNHRETLGTMSNLAGTYERQGRSAEAIALYEELAATCRKELGPEDSYTHATLASLGCARLNHGEVTAATEILRDALAASRRSAVAKDPTAIRVLLLLALARTRARDLVEAESCYREGVALAKETFGEEHPSTLTAMRELAFLIAQKGAIAEAEALARRALAGLRVRPGPDHEMTLQAVRVLARILDMRGGDALAEARALLEEVTPRFARKFGAVHRETVETKLALATVLLDQGETGKAETLLLGVIDERRQAGAPEDSAGSDVKEMLGMLRLQAGRFAEAGGFFQQVHTFRDETFGPDHPQSLGAATNLAMALHGQGRLDEAATLAERTIAAKLRVLGREHPWTRQAQLLLAACYDALGRPDDALEVRRFELETSLLPAMAPEAGPSQLVGAARSLLTHPAAALHDPRRALDFAHRAAELEGQAGGEHLWRCLEVEAMAQHALGDPEAAAATLRRAIAALPAGAPAGELQGRLREYEAGRKR